MMICDQPFRHVLRVDACETRERPESAHDRAWTVLSGIFAVSGVLLILVASAGCRRNQGSAAPITSREGPHADIVAVMNAVGVEETFTATVSGREPFICASTQVDGQWEGPCRRFSIISPRSGTLVATLSWNNHYALILSLKKCDGAEKAMACCRSPQMLKLAVEAGSVFEVEVTLLKDWGREEAQKFDLTTSLEP